jgi:HEAT repeat protein
MGLLSLRVLASGLQGVSPEDAETVGEIEGQLRAQGVKTDTNSLMSAVRSNPDVGIRSDAAQLLGYRREASAKETLLGVLRSDSAHIVRQNAAWALARIGAPQGVAGLKDLLADTEDLKQRSFIASQMAEFGDPSGYKYVVEALASKNSQIRYLCVAHLFAFFKFENKRNAGSIEPVALSQKLLRDPDSKVRREAVSIVGRAVPRYLKRESIQPTIEQISKQDSDAGVRATAERILKAWEFEDSGKSH